MVGHGALVLQLGADMVGGGGGHLVVVAVVASVGQGSTVGHTN